MGLHYTQDYASLPEACIFDKGTRGAVHTHAHTQREYSVKVTIIDNQALHGIIHILRVQSALTGVT